ncbi:MAG: hypothetical protein ACW97Z_12640 [Candidatus Hodarchaeales archaeon]|jgi:hypothetical protein
MGKKCASCNLNLTDDPKVRVYSYWKLKCPDKWHIFVRNESISKKIDAPCSEDKILRQKIRKGFQIKD